MSRNFRVQGALRKRVHLRLRKLRKKNFGKNDVKNGNLGVCGLISVNAKCSALIQKNKKISKGSEGGQRRDYSSYLRRGPKGYKNIILVKKRWKTGS